MSTGGGSRKRGGRTLYAGRGWHCLQDSTSTQGEGSPRRATDASSLKRTAAGLGEEVPPVAKETADYKSDTRRPVRPSGRASKPREFGAAAAPRGASDPERRTVRSTRSNARTGSDNAISSCLGLDEGSMEAGRDSREREPGETSPTGRSQAAALGRRSTTPSSGCSESGRSPQKIDIHGLKEAASNDSLEGVRGKRRGSHRRSCSDASSCTGSGASSTGPNGVQPQSDARNQTHILTDTRTHSADPATQSCETALGAAPDKVLETLERPCTPVAPQSMTDRAPPGAPLRRSIRKRASGLSERFREPSGEFSDHFVNSDALRGEVPETLIEECAERMLLRRGHCAVCGQFRPLRPSAAVCFNLQCKILYDSRQ